MTPALFLRTARTAGAGVFLLGGLIFVAAGTLDYWQGWLFIIVFTIATNTLGLYLALNDPALLERRLRAGPGAEQRPAQRVIITLAIFGFFGLLVFAALDHRFRWSPVPGPVSLAGDALVMLGLFIDLLVFRVNTYGGANIRVIEGQRVISTGPYALVRHPMYSGGLVMALGIPLALGSWWALVAAAVATPLALAWRILDEEAMLRHELAGYREYAARVRYRLIPLLW